MAEKLAQFGSAVTIPVAETAVMTLVGSVDADPPISALPNTPIAGVRTVHIRGTLVVTAVPGAAVQIRCRQGQGTGGTQINSFVTNGAAAPTANQSIAFEFWDSAPIGTVYSLTLSSGTSTGTGNLFADIEEVN